jgi:hypothetical protein
MTTAHLQVAAKIAAVLLAAGVADGKVYRARTRAISSDSPVGVVVRLTRSASLLSSVKGGPTQWRTLVQIECYGRATGGQPDQAADPTVDQVFDALAENPTLDNFVMCVEPLEGDTLSWDFDEMDTSLGCTTANFIVSHQTKGRTLTP